MGLQGRLGCVGEHTPLPTQRVLLSFEEILEAQGSLPADSRRQGLQLQEVLSRRLGSP
jgi:hypothetical protein